MAEFHLAFTWELSSPTRGAGSSASAETISYDFTANNDVSRYNFPIWSLINSLEN